MENPNITLARTLWCQFIYADTSNPERLKREWDNQSEDYRGAWIRVAEFVSGMVQETVIMSELGKLIK